jgi:hypothetical protein
MRLKISFFYFEAREEVDLGSEEVSGSVTSMFSYNWLYNLKYQKIFFFKYREISLRNVDVF